jgi:transcriptional regulator with XRE-family HTH domain
MKKVKTGMHKNANTDLMPFGIFIRRMRIQSGLSLEQMEEKTGIARATLEAIENYMLPEIPHFQEIHDLGSALGISVHFLLDMLKHIPATRNNEWQPSYTAPTDGRVIIAVKMDADLPEPLFIHYVEDDPDGKPWRIYVPDEEWSAYDDGWLSDFTHWMPRPALPPKEPWDIGNGM